MPALLEKPVMEASEPNCEIEKRVRVTDSKASERNAANPPRSALSRKIFLGHEEYLGYTPD